LRECREPASTNPRRSSPARVCQGERTGIKARGVHAVFLTVPAPGGGSGKLGAARCEACSGSARRVRLQETISVRIPPRSRQRIPAWRVRAEREARPGGGQAGDLYLIIAVRWRMISSNVRRNDHHVQSAPHGYRSSSRCQGSRCLTSRQTMLRIPPGTQSGQSSAAWKGSSIALRGEVRWEPDR